MISSLTNRKDINSSSSLYRGIVEENRDPLNIGRLRVRIPSLHGIKGEGVNTEGLPWAMPCFPSAGADHGNFIIPEVNDVVWLLFENSQVDNPVWVGCSYSSENEQGKSLKSVGSDTFKGSNEWKYNLDQVETPSEFLEDNNIKVLYKSPKGFCIYINEADGKENLTIVDRLGQIIRMNSPADSGVVRRDLGDVTSKDKLHQDAFYGSGSIEVRTKSSDNLTDSYIKLSEGVFEASNGISTFKMDDSEVSLAGNLNLEGSLNLSGSSTIGGISFSEYTEKNSEIIRKVNNIIHHSIKLLNTLEYKAESTSEDWSES